MSGNKIILLEESGGDVSLRGTLENWGYGVTVLRDAGELAQVSPADFGLLIASYDLAGPGICQYISGLREKGASPGVIVTTSKVSVDCAVDVMKAGALDYMVCPVDTEKLSLHLETLFKESGAGNGERRVPATLAGKKVKIVTRNRSMMQVLELLDRVADSTASVLIRGESGTGKELVARYIHERSGRSKNAFVAVNCAALPETLMESELFGYEKGAFTGASARKPGKFEIANGGTILLDEITEMPVQLQAKLLRVIQEREVDRLGGGSPVKLDVRILATTNRDIAEEVKKGEFREDLYYRLNVIPVHIPPLRERPDDIEHLASYFIRKFNAMDGRNVKSLTPEALSLLRRMEFPGNVREMENIMQRAVLLCTGEQIEEKDIFLESGSVLREEEPQAAMPLSAELMEAPLKDVEKVMIFHALDKTGGNRTHAAKILGISVRTLRNKLNEYKEKSAPAP